MTKIFNLTFLFLLVFEISKAQTVQVTINASAEKRPVSPYIFGKNNVLPSTYLNNGTNAEVTKANEAGVRLVRQGGGNNSTKYNWRQKLSSHPDWYNNVYANNWDAAAKNLTDKMPGVQGMWSFQLLGKVAANTQHNFPDWNYNGSKWWDGVHQNLAGGGAVNPAGGGKALREGNPDLYLKEWPADSTVGILDKWFGAGGLGYDTTFYRYWSMDNEPEIWSGTHDDVMKTQISAEEFMQLNFKVAKVARAKFPGIKLSGPVPANEWQWYRYGSDGISYKGKKYCWLEYFIIKNEPIYLYTLSKLPATETFVSRTQNALKKKQIDKPEYHISVQLEPLSVNAIVLKAASTSAKPIQSENFGLKVFPNPSSGKINIEFVLNDNSPVNIELFNSSGQKLKTISGLQTFAGKNQIERDLTKYSSGIYWITVRTDSVTETRKFIVN